MSRNVGIALGSGAARGLSHIGVLKALEEEGVRPSVIVGTSMGAFVGGVYAAGRLDELTELVLGLDWKKAAGYFVEMNFPQSGIIEGNKISELLNSLVGDTVLLDLPVRFAAVATDIENGEEVVLDEGALTDTIRASISVPGIFTPARVGDRLLVDGGLVNPVPVSVCRTLGADRVIAVDLNQGRIQDIRGSSFPEDDEAPGFLKKEKPWRPFSWFEEKAGQTDARWLDRVKSWVSRDQTSSLGIFDVLGNSLRIMGEQIAASRLEIDRPDLLIHPRIGHVRFLEFHLAPKIIEAGYRATKRAWRAFSAK